MVTGGQVGVVRHSDHSNVLLRSDTQRCLEVIREREKLYCLLRQTDPQGLRAVGPSWSIDPGTRYSSRQFTFNSSHVARLYRSVIGGTKVGLQHHVMCLGRLGRTLWMELTCSRRMRSRKLRGEDLTVTALRK